MFSAALEESSPGFFRFAAVVEAVAVAGVVAVVVDFHAYATLTTLRYAMLRHTTLHYNTTLRCTTRAAVRWRIARAAVVGAGRG